MKGGLIMEQPNDGDADDYNSMCDFIEEVYGNAFWALQAGATKEGLVSQIDHPANRFRRVGPTAEPMAGSRMSTRATTIPCRTAVR